MLALRCAAPALGLVAVLALSACAPPAPAAPPSASPTPTAFASDEEAFRAAEETYRAYVDALNNVDLADPETFEPVYALLSSDALGGERRSLEKYLEQGASLTGRTEIANIVPDETDGLAATFFVCLDVSEVDVRAADGTDLSDPNRPDVQQMHVRAARPSTTAEMTITHSVGYSDGPAC